MNARRKVGENRPMCFILEECDVNSGYVNGSVLMVWSRFSKVSDVFLQFPSGFIEKNVERNSINLFIIQ